MKNDSKARKERSVARTTTCTPHNTNTQRAQQMVNADIYSDAEETPSNKKKGHETLFFSTLFCSDSEAQVCPTYFVYLPSFSLTSFLSSIHVACAQFDRWKRYLRRLYCVHILRYIFFPLFSNCSWIDKCANCAMMHHLHHYFRTINQRKLTESHHRFLSQKIDSIIAAANRNACYYCHDALSHGTHKAFHFDFQLVHCFEFAFPFNVQITKESKIKWNSSRFFGNYIRSHIISQWTRFHYCFEYVWWPYPERLFY